MSDYTINVSWSGKDALADSDANKIISLSPTKTPEGLVAMLKISTTANREKELLTLRLCPENCRLVQPKTFTEPSISNNIEEVTLYGQKTK